MSRVCVYTISFTLERQEVNDLTSFHAIDQIDHLNKSQLRDLVEGNFEDLPQTPLAIQRIQRKALNIPFLLLLLDLLKDKNLDGSVKREFILSKKSMGELFFITI